MNKKIKKVTDEAELLKKKVQKLTDDGKAKVEQLKKQKEQLEGYQKTAKEKLAQARKIKDKVTEAKEKVKQTESRISKAIKQVKQINIGERLKTAFGAIARKSGASQKQTDAVIKTETSTAIAFVNGSSFEELTLERSIVSSSSDKEDKQRNEEATMTFGSMIAGQNVFAPPPMVSFSKSKNLVITEIDGSDGEVVERYGDKSWEIKLQGIIVDMINHQYPEEAVVKLREFFNTAAPLKVISNGMFADLNIDSIYFTNVDISGVAGFADTIQYTLSARSIKPVEFFFTQSNNLYYDSPIPNNASSSGSAGQNA